MNEKAYRIKIKLVLNNFVFHAFDLVVIMAMVSILLAVVHKYSTHNINVSHTLPNSTVILHSDDPYVRLGDMLPVYRFNWDWKIEIGKVKVINIEGDKITATFNAKDFSWPMGRQGLVTDHHGDSVQINIGRTMDLEVGDQMILFKNRRKIGKIRLTEVSLDSARGNVLFSPTMALVGLTASEFIFPTQVAYFNNPFVFAFEIICISLAIAWWLYKLLAHKRSLLVTVKNWLSSKFNINRTVALWIFNILLAVPFVWLIVTFVFKSVDHFIVKQLWNISPFDLFISGRSLLEMIDIRFFYLLAIVWFAFFLIVKHRSPILAFWNRFSYPHPQGYELTGLVNRGLTIWLLHLIIAYAFASSLHTFLIGNMNSLAGLGWADANLSFSNMASATEGLFHILSHRPQVATIDEAFHIARYALWSFTIIGCLVGYAHSVVSVVWGKHIRNLDFTLMGWITNAICYPPLLGFIIWEMMPPGTGADPIITQGPLYYFVLVTELLLNIFYTSSIWNLGKRFGVMTDKGVCSSGWYSVIRHPNYTLEALMFVILELRGVTGLPQGVAIGMFMFIYYIRSEREDRFMTVSNPDYSVYKKQTPYKFIPGVY